MEVTKDLHWGMELEDTRLLLKDCFCLTAKLTDLLCIQQEGPVISWLPVPWFQELLEDAFPKSDTSQPEIVSWSVCACREGGEGGGSRVRGFRPTCNTRR